MLLSELLTPDRIRIPLRARTKDDLLREMVRLVTDASNREETQDVLRAVREREAVLSTGIGSGVAIPHGKATAVPELRMAAGVSRDPVEFDALDGQPVRLFFLLVGPETASGQHIKALSRISRLLRKDSVRERLIAAVDAADFHTALRESEGL